MFRNVNKVSVWNVEGFWWIDYNRFAEFTNLKNISVLTGLNQLSTFWRVNRNEAKMLEQSLLNRLADLLEKTVGAFTTCFTKTSFFTSLDYFE